ncbi:MAG: putative xanthine dehydrogenase subunit D [Chloroflexi bacterium ADurb.Bin325]|nr:MAG: putative xanthine dehydrogenase subunit D [Chloroflexi bacterium ADurb.Bin325]
MNQSSIGRSLPRNDAPAKVTGRALYPGDIGRPGMLHMATLFAGRPHARIVGLDTAAAGAAAGVVAVLTAADVPVNEYGLQIKDQPVLVGPVSGKAGADVVRFVGDQVALVIAETEAQARAALRLIRVEWEDLPLVLAPEQAMQPGATQLHPHCADNIAYSYRIRKGDLNAGFGAADVVVEGVYRTPVQEHAYLQPEAGVAYIDEAGRITVEVAGQWTHADRKAIAHALDLPVEQVRVIYPAIGGAFGGREDMSVQITLALAAWRLAQRGVRRPVKTVWSREESIIGHGKRHAMTIHTRWGARRDGRLTAAEVRVVADGGAYMYTSDKVLGNTTLTCTGPYEIPHVAVDACAVYTNNVPGAAFRGFGGPQGHFAAESQMDRLAEALGMDPVELRLRNVLTDEKLLTTGTPIPGGVGLTETIIAAATAAGWTQDVAGHWQRPQTEWNADDADQTDGYDQTDNHNNHDHQRHQRSIASSIRRGIGFAAGFKNVGFSFGYQENSYARVELRGESEIEEATVYIAGADVGQGHHTVMAQAAAEALGIPFERVRMVTSDTARMGDAGSASASRLTYMAGNAVRGAAEAALARWRNEDRPATAEHVFLAPKTTRLDHDGQGLPNFAYGYVAQACQVAVDMDTGEVHVERFISADDVGKALNPQQVTGQIEGAVVQALGYALMEDWRTRDGQVLTNRLSTYLIPTVLDIPARLDPVIVEVPDPNGPWGARGMAEMPYLPAAAAVCAAVYDATRVRFTEFPLTSERVWRGLHEPTG